MYMQRLRLNSQISPKQIYRDVLRLCPCILMLFSGTAAASLSHVSYLHVALMIKPAQMAYSLPPDSPFVHSFTCKPSCSVTTTNSHLPSLFTATTSQDALLITHCRTSCILRTLHPDSRQVDSYTPPQQHRTDSDGQSRTPSRTRNRQETDRENGDPSHRDQDTIRV